MSAPSPQDSAPLTVLQVVEPGVNGVFRHVEGLTDFLLRQGVQVDLAYSSRRDSEGLHRLVERVENAGGRTLDLKISNSPQLRDSVALWRLYRLACSRTPQIIHGHSSKAGVLARALALLGIPSHYFYTAHAYYGMNRQADRRTALYNRVEQVFGTVGITINISPDEATFAQAQLRVNPSRQRMIHHEVDTAHFSPASAERKKAARQKLGLPEESVVLGTAARFAWQKDPHTLYQALAEVMPRHPNLYFCHVTSGGEFEEEIRAGVVSANWGQRVVFSSYLEDARDFYDALDGFVLSSQFEAGIPYVIIEALSQGLPLATTAFLGSAGLSSLRLSQCSLAPVGDGEILAQNIEAMLTDIQRHRPNNHRTVAEKAFRPGSSYGKILEYYRQATVIATR